MTSKFYTAQEMREEARFHAIKHGNDYIVAAMLRQAADAMEREEKREMKYEYAEKTCDGIVDSIHEESFQKVAISKFFGDSTIVRRAIGEWKEVKDAREM